MLPGELDVLSSADFGVLGYVDSDLSLAILFLYTGSSIQPLTNIQIIKYRTTLYNWFLLIMPSIPNNLILHPF